MHALLNIAISAIRNAGKIIMRSSERLEGGKIDWKASYDFAIETEQLAATEIINTIHKAYPEHLVLNSQYEPNNNDDYIWIIDPIDGIINYTHAVPHFCTSIAVKRKNKIEHAVIYDPIRQELFTASRGEGAYLNERRIRVSSRIHAEEALLGTGFPRKQMQHLKPYLNTFAALFPELDGIRRSGSSALDLAYVAAGRLEGFWEFSLKEWNMAAGILLVKEAGGLVGDFQGEENYLTSGNLVAGNPKIFKLILQTIRCQIY